ncbi:SAVED domain-containing protein [Bacillus toyonensis]|uniref:SAVED domain-containing protein n=1 Tax=Bacillus toyonensis TaxID=155322 RepID=UPI002541538D|nr:SAVED domain-containing protein [Bacillus toyonensis]WIG25103.1 SAVED domain-containing protein [Bacillus toyonensis]
MNVLAFFIIILVIAIIGIGAFFAIKQFVSQNKEQGISSLLITTGLSLIVGSFGSFWDKPIQILSILKNSKTAKESIDITKEMSEPNVLQLIAGAILMIVGIYFWQYIKNKIFILNINGYYDKRIEGHNRDLGLGTFEFKEREIDFVQTYKKGIKPTTTKDIANMLKEKVTSFKDESKEFKRGYTGIAPIPFIALAGTHLQREKIDHYFEFDKVDTEKFYELTEGNDYSPLEVKTNLNNLNPNATEVVLSVSVTKEITDAQLTQFQGIDVVKLEVDTPEDNKIRYTNQVKEYANTIMNTIEEIGAKMPLTKVHLVCSSQSCLALEIGKRIDNQRMAQVICYFFDNQQPKKYPWGIVINGNEKGKYIQA